VKLQFHERKNYYNWWSYIRRALFDPKILFILINKTKNRIPCVYYILHYLLKKNVFCSTIHRRKMPKNILQITSHHVFKYHHWTIFYKTKTNFSCWLVFRKIHNGRRCIVVYSFLFFLKKSCDPIESTQVLSWWWWRRNFFALSLILLSGYIFLLRKKKILVKMNYKTQEENWLILMPPSLTF